MSALCGAVRMSLDYGNVNGQSCWVLGADSLQGVALCAALKHKKADVVPIAAGAAAPASAKPAQFIFNGVGGSALRAATDRAADGCRVVTFADTSGERTD